jgi:hypothetical protein
LQLNNDGKNGPQINTDDTGQKLKLLHCCDLIRMNLGQYVAPTEENATDKLR